MPPGSTLGRDHLCYTGAMIHITPSLAIAENELQFNFIRSSGPGGQNVNKVASGVQLRFNIDASPTLPEDVKQRLRSIARNRITDDGDLIIEAKRFRTQEQNRADAVARLIALVSRAAERPEPRKRTRPSAAAQARRIAAKKHRSVTKHRRQISPHDLE